MQAGSHRNDYERIQLKTDLRLVKIIKSESKPFHICLKNMFSDNIVKLFFKIHNFPCLKPLPVPLVFHNLLCVNRP